MTECSKAGCSRPAHTRGLCRSDYSQTYKAERRAVRPARETPRFRPGEAPSHCTVKGCGGKHRARGYCERHYRRVLISGSPDDHRRVTGAAHPSWKGGIRVHSSGYVSEHVERDDPMFCMVTEAKSYVAQHRLVMARALGRPLESWESVHHINGNRADNRLSNLQLRIGNHGRGAVFRCRSCGSHDIEPVELP